MTQRVALFSSELLSPRPGGPLSRLFLSLRLIFHSKTSLGGVNIRSPTADVPDRSGLAPQAVDRSLPMDPDEVCEHLIDLVSRIPSLLPDSGEWLERGVLEVIGGHPIAAGDVADIWVGILGNRKVAIKSYRYSSSSNYMPTYVRFYKEASACSRLRGPNVVPFIGIHSTPEHLSALVFEFMPHLDLREYLKNNREVGRLELLLEIARGVERMHGLNVAHGNLKSTNILVDPGGHAYIAGLGAAPVSPARPGVDIDRFFYGTAPELVDPQRFGSSNIGATKASDIYAFAMLAWEIFTGKVPFSNECRIAAVFSMLRGRRPARPDHPELSDRLWRMIEGCWKVDPTKRKTIDKVVTALEAGVAARQSKLHWLYRNRT